MKFFFAMAVFPCLGVWAGIIRDIRYSSPEVCVGDLHLPETYTAETPLVMMSAANESRAALEKLAANATWDERWHGALSVSVNGRQLVYTSCARPGMAVLVK